MGIRFKGQQRNLGDGAPNPLGERALLWRILDSRHSVCLVFENPSISPVNDQLAAACVFLGNRSGGSNRFVLRAERFLTCRACLLNGPASVGSKHVIRPGCHEARFYFSSIRYQRDAEELLFPVAAMIPPTAPPAITAMMAILAPLLIPCLGGFV